MIDPDVVPAPFTDGSPALPSECPSPTPTTESASEHPAPVELSRREVEETLAALALLFRAAWPATDAGAAADSTARAEGWDEGAALTTHGNGTSSIHTRPGGRWALDNAATPRAAHTAGPPVWVTGAAQDTNDAGPISPPTPLAAELLHVDLAGSWHSPTATAVVGAHATAGAPAPLPIQLSPFQAQLKIVPTAAIRVSPLWMRRGINPAHVAALAASAARWGLLTPLIGRALADGVGHELFGGRHRLEGLRMAQVDTAWMLVFPADTPDAVMEFVGVESNLRCHAPSRFELIMALLRVDERNRNFSIAVKGSLQERLAQAAGVDRSTISRALKTIAPAISEVRDAWRAGLISSAEVEQLATLPPAEQSAALAATVARHRAAVPMGDTEDLAGDRADEPRPPASLADEVRALRAEMQALRAQQDGTAVSTPTTADDVVPDAVPATAVAIGNATVTGSDAGWVPSPAHENLRRRLAVVVAAGGGLYRAAWAVSVDTKRMRRWLNGERPPKALDVVTLAEWLAGAEQKLAAERANSVLRRKRKLRVKDLRPLYEAICYQFSVAMIAKALRVASLDLLPLAGGQPWRELDLAVARRFKRWARKRVRVVAWDAAR
ncbi:MAG: ParB N-terminal domain-containing protein [Polyangiales bacterium]